MDYITVSAKTLDDAITEALIQLGVTSDRLDYVVIEKGSAGFFGIGMKQAVIKARKKVEEPVVEEIVAPEPVKEIKKEVKKEAKKEIKKEVAKDSVKKAPKADSKKEYKKDFKKDQNKKAKTEPVKEVKKAIFIFVRFKRRRD